ncbi:MAG: hypothetical protein RLZZ138_225 [Actinomycetota bacterium]
MKRLSLLFLPFLLAGCTYSTSIETLPTTTPSAATEAPAETSAAAPTPSTEAAEVKTTLSQVAEPNQDNVLEELLASLQITAEYPFGYDRNLFRHWIDADSDGCNTRREVLIVESISDPQVGESCAVYGTWLSRFDNRQITDAAELDIDHLVPLAEAWRSGAYRWSADTRKRFANDLGFAGTLIAVTASSNRSKSDKDPASWLPSNDSYLCQYGYDWLAVKYRWSLTIDSDEALALAKLVPSCGGDYQIPNKAEVTFGAPQPTPTSTKAGQDPRFGTCKEAKANGFGPYLKGVDEEYDWYRDGDSDGTVCE